MFLQSCQLNCTLTWIVIQQLPHPVLLQPSGCPPVHFRGKSRRSKTNQTASTNTHPSQTDSSRTKAIELEIQKRVAQELERLHQREKQTLAEIEKQLSEVKNTGSVPVTAATAPIAPTSSGYPVGSLNLDAPRVPFAGREYEPSPVLTAPAAAPQAAVANRDISRDSVANEIEQLRSRLDGRRKLAELDEGVSKAKADVVGCLRLNDRRPLDCWQEVDAFKREVAKMEQAFVDRIVG
jgi:altered-inheritance-of-mitochondria protein 13